MNLQQIADILEFDLEDVMMLMDMFLDNAQQSLDEAEEAIEANSYEDIKNIAHAIKGSASNLMLDSITNAALEIEQLAKSESEVDYRSLFSHLQSELTHIEELKEAA